MYLNMTISNNFSTEDLSEALNKNKQGMLRLAAFLKVSIKNKTDKQIIKLIYNKL